MFCYFNYNCIIYKLLYSINFFSLRILQATHHNEGEYQCSAIVRQIKIASNLTIDTRLVSAPLKLKRARITKFERYDSFIVRVRQGQVYC